MDFDDTDQDKEKTTSQNGEFTPSLEEKLRILGNREWAQGLFDDVDGDADGKDETDLSGSVDHFKTGLVANGAISSGMYSALEARIDRAWQRNVREEMQQIQISIIEDREEKKRKQEEAAEEEFEGSIDRVKAEEKREREREEWSKSTHSYAGMDLTGEEWGELSDKLSSNSPLRKWLVDKLMAKGKSRTESERTADEVALLAKMQSIPKDQWTDEMKALDAKLEANPEHREELNELLRDTATNERSGLKVKLDNEAQTASRTISIEARTDQFDAGSGQSDASKLIALNRAMVDIGTSKEKLAKAASDLQGDEPFSSAPDLGEHYQSALQATEPLDADKAKPQQIAANDLKATQPAAAPGSGFAV